MKKICFVDFDVSLMGGLERVLTSVANELCPVYEVHILSLNNSGGKPYFPLDERIHYHALHNANYRIRTLMLNCFFPLIRYFNDNRIDLAFLMGNYPAPIVLPVRPFVKTKLIFCDHGALENQLKSRKVMLFRRFASKRADKVITLTKQNRDAYIRLFHMKEADVEYLYNWIDPEIFRHTGPYQKDSRRLLSVGRFGEEKGYDLLVPLGKRIFAKHPDWQWHVYGDGELFGQIQKEIETNGLQRNIVLKGATKRMYDYYKDYSLCILTSYREGLPLVLLEAKANGLPVVSFDILTGPREIVEDGKDGYLIPPYDTEKMAEEIGFLIEHDNVRQEMSDYAHTHLDKFKKETILRKWIDFIDRNA